MGNTLLNKTRTAYLKSGKNIVVLKADLRLASKENN